MNSTSTSILSKELITTLQFQILISIEGNNYVLQSNFHLNRELFHELNLRLYKNFS